jgi:hypothetical protein
MDYGWLIDRLKERKKIHPNRKHWIDESIAKPYTEDELMAFERHLGERLPEDFRNYMLNVSKEVFNDYYPVIVDDLAPKNGICRVCGDSFSGMCKIKDFGVPADMKFWISNSWYGKPLECPKCKCVYNGSCMKCDIGNTNEGQIQVGRGPNANRDLLIIKGPHKGSVWSTDNDSICILAHTFKEYVESF